MELIQKDTIGENLNKHLPSNGTSWFRRFFSRNRFQLILIFIHITDSKRIKPQNGPKNNAQSSSHSSGAKGPVCQACGGVANVQTHGYT
ncbi:hypothetical protein DPMN_109581 [Dreissena polymorpha]|uniref:Uncharacterized protein n=1 Tax=Dreissena polymorpha TaxID=45954 RepID=A0A9D4KAU4_DREPO|nr:hypothetical protein DPMN_109581 [Dreissena polymorpha]